MHNLFVLDKSTDALLKDAVVLIDTNFLIDAWLFKKEAVELLARLRELNCYLATINLVAVEFLGGTKNQDDLNGKLEFLETLFARPKDKIFIGNSLTFPAEDDFLEFSRQASNFSCTDFELYRTLKKYKGKLLLMTRNHKDFTSPTFARKGFITLLGQKEVHTHGLYAYTK